MRSVTLRAERSAARQRGNCHGAQRRATALSFLVAVEKGRRAVGQDRGSCRHHAQEKGCLYIPSALHERHPRPPVAQWFLVVICMNKLTNEQSRMDKCLTGI